MLAFSSSETGTTRIIRVTCSGMKSIVLLLVLTAAVRGATLAEEREEDALGVLPQYSECGRPFPRDPGIDEGLPATFGDQPWLAGIHRQIELYPQTLTCEGALINERYVITAAECVNGTRMSGLTVRLGDFDIDGYPHEDHKVGSRIVHERFEKVGEVGFVNDIALLELAEPVVYKKHILPICLPERNAGPISKPATVSGWSLMTVKHHLKSFSEQMVDAFAMDHKLCNAAFAEKNLKKRVPETSLCVHLKDDREAPCLNGSPLILKGDGRSRIMGMSSGILLGECGKFNTPTIYTDLTKYREWIESNIKAGKDVNVEARALKQKLTRMDNTFRIMIDVSTIVIFVFAVVFMILAAIIKELLRHDESIKQLKQDLIANIEEQPPPRRRSVQPEVTWSSRKSYGSTETMIR